MSRIFWTIIGLLLLLWVLSNAGAFAPFPMLDAAVHSILGGACFFAFPLFFFAMIYAPGLFRDLTSGITHFFERTVSQRREVADLKHKVARLDKAHHMAQLGIHYMRQGRFSLAAKWFGKALEKDDGLLDARYRLALCHFAQSDYGPAVELLEAVHREKPEHDYGVAYLRLAQANHRIGKRQRAGEVYETLLKFYPGQPEGSYSFALLKAELGETDKAQELMREVIFAVSNSPGFQRRRNRHWNIKARWWLLRN